MFLIFLAFEIVLLALALIARKGLRSSRSDAQSYVGIFKVSTRMMGLLAVIFLIASVVSMRQRHYDDMRKLTRDYALKFQNTIEIYASDNEGLLPLANNDETWHESLKQELFDYMKFDSPAGGKLRPNTLCNGKKLSELNPNTIIAYDTYVWPDGKQMVIYSGHPATYIDSSLLADQLKIIRP
jgi:hypothetical protein